MQCDPIHWLTLTQWTLINRLIPSLSTVTISSYCKENDSSWSITSPLSVSHLLLSLNEISFMLYLETRHPQFVIDAATSKTEFRRSFNISVNNITIDEHLKILRKSGFSRCPRIEFAIPGLLISDL